MPWDDLTPEQQKFLDAHFTRHFSDFFTGRENQQDNVKTTADYERAVELARTGQIQIALLHDSYPDAKYARANLEDGQTAIAGGDFKTAIGLLSGITDDIARALDTWTEVVADLRAEAGTAADVPDTGDPERLHLTGLGAEILALLVGNPLPSYPDVDAARVKVKALREAKVDAPGKMRERIRSDFTNAFAAARDGLEKAATIDQTPFAKVAGKDNLAAAIETAGNVLQEALTAEGSADQAVLQKATASLLAVMKPPVVEDLRLKCDAELADRKRKVAGIGTTQAGLQSEITRLCKLPEDTADAGAIQRRIAMLNTRLTPLVQAEDLEGAVTGLDNLQEAIAEMALEEVEIAKAAVVKEKAWREWEDLAADLKAARAIHAVTPTLDAVVKAFSEADTAVQAKLNAKSFGAVFAAIDTLKSAMANLMARKGEFDACEVQRVEVMKVLKALLEDLPEASKTPPYTPEAAQALARLQAIGESLEKLMKTRDWDVVLPIVQEGLDKARLLISLRASCDLLESKADAINDRYKDLKEEVEDHFDEEAIDPPYVQQLALIREKLAEAKTLLRKEGNLAAASLALDELDRLALPLDDMKDKNDEAIDRYNEADEEYEKHKDTLLDVADITPNTDSMLALVAKADADLDAFNDAHEQGHVDVMDLLNTAVASAQAAHDAVAEDEKAASQAKAAYKAREKVIEPEVDAAADLATEHAPDLDDAYDEAEALWNRAAELYNEKRFLEGLAELEKAGLAAARVAGMVPQAEAKMQGRKEDFERRYVKALTDKVDAIQTYPNVRQGIESAKTALVALNEKIKKHRDAEAWAKALGALDTLETDVTALTSLKAELDQRIIDRDWLVAERAKIAARITQATEMSPVDRQIDAAVKRFRAASAISGESGAGFNYAQARAGFPEYVAAIDALLQLRSQHDLLVGQRNQFFSEYAVLRGDTGICAGIRPLTPELAKLVEAFRKAADRVNKHLSSYDFSAAIVALPALEKAVKALVVKKDDHDNALQTAKDDAVQAALDLTDISDEDLKNKTADEKLDLLAKLRGTKEALLPEQRKLQVKVYMALDLDPDFLKVDEERRTTLIEKISGDQDLMAARDTWAKETPEKRIALLQKTIKTECEIYGMPEPRIIMFEEPLGDAGTFNDATGTIRINIHPDGTFGDFFEAIDTIVHENAHNYQNFMVKRLKEGLILPGDPEYKQALMFAANYEPFGYVDDNEDSDCYKKEPVEEHAWKTGGDVQAALKKAPAKAG